MTYAIPMTISFPTQSREDFANQFEDVEDFIHYVKHEHSVTKGEWCYSLFPIGNKVVIEERPIGNLSIIFDETTHEYAIDESWRYIAMDWFDAICGLILDM